MSADQGCLFCKIIAQQIPAKTVYEDQLAIAFEDINPQAPVHVLIVPRKHIPDISSMTDKDRELVGHLFWVAAKLASENGLIGGGYRMVINNGREAGQTVFHIHLHLLGGRVFAWPPG
ncbi:MAG: histidine triad nucleotide-binding protein [Nitrospirae bacterium GWC2_57_13]|jgi:histidine triad (HIT) family protein|nr:MAG: histidine triad nucleotide-binding protein [Nitrospirae bacterium GWC1_57_7]OGW27594.1 MAG: histidine triad nucleotide-binding protein [Nitrospirae bacterium GWC2_57_13]HAR45110.1 histidine triad nucleotide-binding protein [Nitrospiraceae bacterium]HAS55029.1 histidine triad nucleotide-binding protein [Nitrospiraceae bacterium]